MNIYKTYMMSKIAISKLALIYILCMLLLSCRQSIQVYKIKNHCDPYIINKCEIYIGVSDNIVSNDLYKIQDALNSNNWSKACLIKDVFKYRTGKMKIVRIKLPEIKKNMNNIYIAEQRNFIRLVIDSSLIDNANRFNSKNAFNYCIAESANRNIYMLFKMNPNTENNVYGILVGSQFQIEKKIFHFSFVNISISIILIFIGILLIVENTIVIHSRIIHGISFYLLSMSFFILCNNPFLYRICNNPKLLYYINYISLIFLSCAILFITETIIYKYKKPIKNTYLGTVFFIVIVVIYVACILILQLKILSYYIVWFALSIFIYLIIRLFNIKAIPSKNKVIESLLIIGESGFFISIILEIEMHFIIGSNSLYGYCVNYIQYGTIWLIIFLLLMETIKIRNDKEYKKILIKNEYNNLKKNKTYIDQLDEKYIKYKEDERNKIAIELHDSIGQNLIIIRNELLTLIPNEKDEDTKKLLAQITSLTGSTIQEARDITQNLSPRLLTQLGLDAAIDSLIELYKKSYPMNYIVSIEKIDKYIKEEHKINIYRIIQESFTNIFKHAQATEIIFYLKLVNNSVFICIKDNGVGINDLKENEYSGLGIYGMKYRAKLIGGEFKIGLSEEQGTQIQLTYPIKGRNIDN